MVAKTSTKELECNMTSVKPAGSEGEVQGLHNSTCSKVPMPILTMTFRTRSEKTKLR